MTSRTVPWTPANRPSSQTETDVISAGNDRPVAVLDHVAEATDDVVLVALRLEVRERLGAATPRPVRSANVMPTISRRCPAEERFRALGHEQEAAVGVAAVDDVRRRLDELAEARLRLLQLALEPVALAHVADRAVGADEPAVLVEPRRSR